MTCDLFGFWRSKVKVTAGRPGGEDIHVDAIVEVRFQVFSSVACFFLWGGGCGPWSEPIVGCSYSTANGCTYRRRTRRCPWSWRLARRCRRLRRPLRRRPVVVAAGERTMTRRETTASARPRPRWTRSPPPCRPIRRRCSGNPAHQTVHLNAGSTILLECLNEALSGF